MYLRVKKGKLHSLPIHPPLRPVPKADVGLEADTQAEEVLMAFLSQGMGGQHNYFGLWIDVDFGKGHSKAKPTCTTYNSPQLSAQEDFRFEKMEVWAVGDASQAQMVSVGAFLHFLGFTPFAGWKHLETVHSKFVSISCHFQWTLSAGQRDASGCIAESCGGPWVGKRVVGD